MFISKKLYILSTIISFFVLSGISFSQEDQKINGLNLLEIEKGEKSSPVTIIEYASYTCPHCATFHKNVFKKIEKEYVETGKVRFIYREIYFDAPGLWAGLLARCKNNSRYFGILDLLYEKQDLWSMANSEKEIVEQLLIIAKQAGIEKQEALACLNDKEKAIKLVDFMKLNVENDNISSTPSFIINGTLYSNMNYDEIKEIIDSIISNF